MNNNGILSFSKGVEKFSPRKFPIKDGVPVIAPFWADVDTTSTGKVFYREVTSNELLLTKAKNQIRAAFVNELNFEPEMLFIATWYRVGHYRNQSCLVCIIIL